MQEILESLKVQLLLKKKLWAFENFQFFSFSTRFQENPVVLVSKIWNHRWENGNKIFVLRDIDLNLFVKVSQYTNIKSKKISGGVTLVKF